MRARLSAAERFLASVLQKGKSVPDGVRSDFARKMPPTHADAQAGRFCCARPAAQITATWLAVALLLPVGMGSCSKKQAGRSEAYSHWLAALGSSRPSEARLSGFSYSPFSSARRSGVPQILLSEDLIHAQREILSAGESRDPTPVSLWDLGVVHLISGRLEKATSALERASRLSPDEAHLWNDLAVAYFELSGRSEDPYFYSRSMTAVLQALRIDPKFPEARFNRALLLSALFLKNQASQAWGQALAVESSQGFRREIESRRRRLLEMTVSAAWQNNRSRILDLAAQGSPEANGFSQQIREWAMRQGFREWIAVREADPEQAERLLSRLLGIGQWLGDNASEESVLETAQLFSQAPKSGHGPLIRSVVLYGQGEEQFYGGHYQQSKATLEEARVWLESEGSTLRFWCDVTLALIDVYKGAMDPALDRVNAAMAEVSPLRFPALAGRLEWVAGLIKLRRRHLLDAFGHFDRAAHYFEQSKEEKNLGSIHILKADVLRPLGRSRFSWRHLHKGLELLSQHTDYYWWHNALLSSSVTLEQEGQLMTALQFREEDVQSSLGLEEDPDLIVEALRWRAQLRTRIGMRREALRDLDQAELLTARVADADFRRFNQLDLRLARAALLGQSDPAAALHAWQGLIAAYERRQRVSSVMSARLLGVQILNKLNRPVEARSLLIDSIQELESQNTRLVTHPFRVDHFQQLNRLYDEIIQQQLDSENHLSALRYSERKNSSLFGQPAPPSVAGFGATRLAERIPQDALVVEYAVLPHQTAIWVLSREGVQPLTSPAGSERLDSLVRALLAARISQPEGEAKALLRQLHEYLIAPFQDSLAGRKRLLVIPDEVLLGVPFGALLSPSGQHLIEQVGVAKALSLAPPSLTQEQKSRAEGRSGSLLVGGIQVNRALFPFLPSLPGSVVEVESIAAIHGTGARLLKGPAATRHSVLQGLQEAEVFHFAGHSLSGQSSGLLLHSEAEDTGQITPEDLYSRRFDGLRLVVLSACSSGDSLASQRHGAYGLAHPFLAGGTSAVVATLWQVDDRASQRLMVNLHRLAFDDGLDLLSALQQAQLAELRRSSGQPSWNWAAFDLIVAHLEQLVR